MKNTLLIFICLSLMALISCVDDDTPPFIEPVDLRSGLVAYYPLNGNANDASTNSFDGTISSGTQLFENGVGIEQQSYFFNDIDDVITTSTEIDDELSEALTFSAWIYLSETGFTGRILSNYNGVMSNLASCDDTINVGFIFGVTEEGAVNVFYNVSPMDYNGRITSGNSFEIGKWYHIAATWDGTYESSSFRIFIDGERSDSSDFEMGNNICNRYYESMRPFQIGLGSCQIGACAPFKGAIDEVRIYNRILNQSEIEALSLD